MKPQIAIVVPCFNEEALLPASHISFLDILNTLKKDTVHAASYILYVDDGSTDSTWSIITDLNARFPNDVQGLKLSRNHGHQPALLAGLSTAAGCDATLSADADLQDDLHAIPAMVRKYIDGNEIVYGVRKERRKDSFFKKNTALLFYSILTRIGVETVRNHADFRLIGQRALKTLLSFPEKNLYLRGMVPLLGFSSAKVYYDRQERLAGDSKYNLTKMLSLAWNGITSLSIKPLRFVTACGFIVFILSIGLSAYALYSYIFRETVPGWTSIVLPVYFLGGIQLLCIGLIGEYIGKIYQEVKGRPRFIIEEHLRNTDCNK